jgi:hypothetical protein
MACQATHKLGKLPPSGVHNCLLSGVPKTLGHLILGHNSKLWQKRSAIGRNNPFGVMSREVISRRLYSSHQAPRHPLGGFREQ